jgi:hypothetical protein
MVNLKENSDMDSSVADVVVSPLFLNRRSDAMVAIDLR